MILVIGAGIAGLSCTQELLKKGLKVRFFEASNKYGGRVQPLYGFSKRSLEAGGQTIHHPDNDYYRMAIQAGVELESGVDLIGSIYDPIQKKVISYEEFTKTYPKEASSLDVFIEERDTEDETVLERLQKKGYNLEFLHYFTALYGSEYGASIDKIGAKAIGRYEFDMPMFVSDYEISNNMHHKDIIDKYFQEAIQIIEYNKPVTEINVINGKVEVKVNQESLIFDQVVCCVPITQVKKIKFQPPFDDFRQKQLDLVGMEKGGKFFIKLNKKFLTHEEDFFVPKFNHNSLWWDNSHEEDSVIIGLLGQDAHDLIEKVGPEQYAKDVVQTINQQYQVDLEIIQIHYQNWGNTPYIEGLYSFPKPGIDNDYRKIISQPHCEKVYFAGEAYHPVYYSTIHGAFETGVQVAQLIK